MGGVIRYPPKVSPVNLVLNERRGDPSAPLIPMTDPQMVQYRSRQAARMI